MVYRMFFTAVKKRNRKDVPALLLKKKKIANSYVPIVILFLSALKTH